MKHTDRNAYKLPAVVLAVVMIVTLMPAAVPARADDISGLPSAPPTASGSCGTNVTWSFWSVTGLLYISGSGEMDPCWCGDPDDPGYDAYRNAVLTAVIGRGVTSIGDYAFCGCTGMTSVVIPDTVTVIGTEAFEGCTSLESAELPVGLVSIGAGAFNGCGALTDLHIPASVTDVGWLAFSACSGLTLITVDEQNPVYCASGNCLIERGSRTLLAGCRNSEIPDDGSVAVIGDKAFYACRGLIRAVIPGGVRRIGESAFADCTDLVSIGIRRDTAFIGDDAFAGCVLLTLYCETEIAPAGWSEWWNPSDCQVVWSWNDQPGTFSLFGTVNAPGPDGAIVMTLTDAGTGEIAARQTVTALSDTVYIFNGDMGYETMAVCDTIYAFEHVPVGQYVLTISGGGRVARELEVTVDGDVLLNATVNIRGDINGDGVLTAVDVAMLNSCARGLMKVYGYTLACADVMFDDGRVTTADAAKVNAVVKGTSVMD